MQVASSTFYIKHFNSWTSITNTLNIYTNTLKTSALSNRQPNILIRLSYFLSFSVHFMSNFKKYSQLQLPTAKQYKTYLVLKMSTWRKIFQSPPPLKHLISLSRHLSTRLQTKQWGQQFYESWRTPTISGSLLVIDYLIKINIMVVSIYTVILLHSPQLSSFSSI